MTVALLDINDCNVQLWSPQQQLQSPGYALLQGANYLFGRPARGSARLQPRNINTRYWWQLNTEALQPALGPARHTADLVHAHLLALHREAGEPSELLIAAPGSMQREQLALLLGIAQQCPFKVRGLINRSTLLSSACPRSDNLFHLEVQLHQTLLSELSSSADGITVQRSIPIPGCGLLQLQERLVEIIAASFISQTRFDPRRKADTEQSLYDALPATLQTLAQTTQANIEVNGYRARIDRIELEAAGKRLFDSLNQALPVEANVIADPIAGLLPGLTTRFPRLSVSPSEMLWQACQQHGERLLSSDDQAISFIRTLPYLYITDEPEVIEPAPTTTPIITPTHLLDGYQAVALEDTSKGQYAEFEFFHTDQGWRSNANNLLLGDTPYQPGQLLAAGEVLCNADGKRIQLITVQAP